LPNLWFILIDFHLLLRVINSLFCAVFFSNGEWESK
jgi:hypothetical protein